MSRMIRNCSFVVLLASFLALSATSAGATPTITCESATWGVGYPLVHDDGTCDDAEGLCAQACWECYNQEDFSVVEECDVTPYNPPATGTWYYAICNCGLFPQ